MPVSLQTPLSMQHLDIAIDKVGPEQLEGEAKIYHSTYVRIPKYNFSVVTLVGSGAFSIACSLSSETLPVNAVPQILDRWLHKMKFSFFNFKPAFAAYKALLSKILDVGHCQDLSPIYQQGVLPHLEFPVTSCPLPFGRLCS